MANSFPSFDDYIGNSQIKSILSDYISISRKNKTPFPHTIIHGQSGCGKTALVYGLAGKLGVPMVYLNCGDNPNIIIVLMKMSDRSILYLDEFHSLSSEVQEKVLYNYIDSNTLHRDCSGMIEEFDLPSRISIIATTNEVQQVTEPMLNRFGLNLRLKPYTHDEICELLSRHVKQSIDSDALSVLSSATRYVPRIGIHYAKYINDYAASHNLSRVTKDDIIKVLMSHGIDENALSEDDRLYISTMYKNFSGGPVGLTTLVGMLNDNRKSIETREIWLMQSGILLRTSKGRMLTAKGLKIAMEI